MGVFVIFWLGGRMGCQNHRNGTTQITGRTLAKDQENWGQAVPGAELCECVFARTCTVCGVRSVCEWMFHLWRGDIFSQWFSSDMCDFTTGWNKTHLVKNLKGSLKERAVHFNLC